MLITPSSWTILIIAAWAVRSIKKQQIYKQFENEIQAYRRD